MSVLYVLRGEMFDGLGPVFMVWYWRIKGEGIDLCTGLRCQSINEMKSAG